MVTLWEIKAKKSFSDGRGRSLVKGMFVELLSDSMGSPLNDSRQREEVSGLFVNKYGRKAAIDPYYITGVYFDGKKIG